MDLFQLMQKFIILIVNDSTVIEIKIVVVLSLGYGCLKSRIERNSKDGAGGQTIEFLKGKKIPLGRIMIAV